MPSSAHLNGPMQEPATQPRAVAIDSLPGLGAQIRAMRKAQRLRIDDTAALCGVSLDLLSRLENGKGGVGSDKLLAVLDGLGLAMVIVPKQDPLIARLPQA